MMRGVSLDRGGADRARPARYSVYNTRISDSGMSRISAILGRSKIGKNFERGRDSDSFKWVPRFGGGRGSILAPGETERASASTQPICPFGLALCFVRETNQAAPAVQMRTASARRRASPWRLLGPQRWDTDGLTAS